MHLYHDKMMQLTEKQEFNCTPQQKQTLRILHRKYKINTSQFIRQAIDEKLKCDKEGIINQFKEVREYLRKQAEYPY